MARDNADASGVSGRDAHSDALDAPDVSASPEEIFVEKKEDARAPSQHYYPGAGKHGQLIVDDTPSSLEAAPEQAFGSTDSLWRSARKNLSNLQLAFVAIVLTTVLAVSGIFIYNWWSTAYGPKAAAARQKAQLEQKKRADSPKVITDTPNPLGLSDAYERGVRTMSFPFSDSGTMQSNESGSRIAVLTDRTLQLVDVPRGEILWEASAAPHCIPYFLGKNIACGKIAYSGEDGKKVDIVPPSFPGYKMTGTIAYSMGNALIETVADPSSGTPDRLAHATDTTGFAIDSSNNPARPSTRRIHPIAQSHIWAVNSSGQVVWHHASAAPSQKIETTGSTVALLPYKGVVGTAILQGETGLPTCSLHAPKLPDTQLLAAHDGYMAVYNDAVAGYDCNGVKQWEEPWKLSLLSRIRLLNSGADAAYTPADLKQVRTYLTDPDQTEAWWLDASANSPVYMLDSTVRTTSNDEQLASMKDIKHIKVTEGGKVSVMQLNDSSKLSFIKNATGKEIASVNLPSDKASLGVYGYCVGAIDTKSVTVFLPEKI